MGTKSVVVIPARYKSSRLPGKPLVHLLGKPMIIWVAELAAKGIGRGNVFVATDDERIKNVVESYNFNVVMTSSDHLTGTDRVAEVAKKIDSDIYINIQGDEPTLDPKSINKVLKAKIDNPGFIINCMSILNAGEYPDNVNIPKVIFNEKNEMVYMSRLPVPGFKSSGNKPAAYHKQVCIYAYSKEELALFLDFGRKSVLEKCEDIEILRFLEFNMKIKMIELDSDTFAVDVEDDINVVENRLKEIHGL